MAGCGVGCGHTGEGRPAIGAGHVGFDGRLRRSAGVAFQPAVEPGEDFRIPVNGGVAEGTVADLGEGSTEAAMRAVGDDDGLRAGGIFCAGLFEEGGARWRGDVVGGFGPEAGDPDRVGVGDAIFGPGGVSRPALQVFLDLGVGRACSLREVDHRQVHAGGVEGLCLDALALGEFERRGLLRALCVREACGKLGPVERHGAEEIVRPAHLPDAAAPEVSAFAMRAGFRDADARGADDDGLVCGVGEGGELQLVLGGGRAAIGGDGAAGPGLFRDPVERVPAVFVGAAQHAHLAFGEIAAALVLLDDGVACAEELLPERTHLGFIGRPDEDDGELALRLREPDGGAQADAIAHGGLQVGHGDGASGHLEFAARGGGGFGCGC